MTLSVYPSSPEPVYSYIFETEFRTAVTDMESGAESAIIKWRFPKRALVMVYKRLALSSVGRDPIYEFFHNRKGRGEAFWVFDIQKRKIIDEYVGYGDDVTATFDLHSKTTDNDTTLKVYVAGVLQTKTVDYDFVSGGGEGESDRITFIAGHIPALGALITSDFNGYLRIKARFNSDKLSEDLYFHNRETISITLLERKN